MVVNYLIKAGVLELLTIFSLPGTPNPLSANHLSLQYESCNFITTAHNPYVPTTYPLRFICLFKFQRSKTRNSRYATLNTKLIVAYSRWSGRRVELWEEGALASNPAVRNVFFDFASEFPIASGSPTNKWNLRVQRVNCFITGVIGYSLVGLEPKKPLLFHILYITNFQAVPPKYLERELDSGE